VLSSIQTPEYLIYFSQIDKEGHAPLIVVLYICVENQVRGLDDEEAHFLDTVMVRQGEIEKNRQDEENALLDEYRVSF